MENGAMANVSDIKLEYKNVSKRYGNRVALEEVCLAFKKGIHGLYGPNGSGKSTLLQLTAVQMRPSKGEILWNGEDIYKLKTEYRRLIGYVPQVQSLYPDFTVMDFMRYMAALKEIPVENDLNEINKILDAACLEDLSNVRIRNLSGGMKQRLLIAQSLLGSPRLLVLDEPTVGLDRTQRESICQWIQECSGNSIVFVSSHIADDLHQMTEDVVVLENGHVVDVVPETTWYQSVLNHSDVGGLEKRGLDR